MPAKESPVRLVAGAIYGKSEADIEEMDSRLRLIDEYLEFIDQPEAYDRIGQSSEDFLEATRIVRAAENRQLEPRFIAKLKSVLFYQIESDLMDNWELREIYHALGGDPPRRDRNQSAQIWRRWKNSLVPIRNRGRYARNSSRVIRQSSPRPPPRPARPRPVDPRARNLTLHLPRLPRRREWTAPRPKRLRRCSNVVWRWRENSIPSVSSPTACWPTSRPWRENSKTATRKNLSPNDRAVLLEALDYVFAAIPACKKYLKS